MYTVRRCGQSVYDYFTFKYVIHLYKRLWITNTLRSSPADCTNMYNLMYALQQYVNGFFFFWPRYIIWKTQEYAKGLMRKSLKNKLEINKKKKNTILSRRFQYINIYVNKYFSFYFFPPCL